MVTVSESAAGGRLEEAEIHSWGGEIEGIKASLEAGRAKLTAVRRSAAKRQPGLTDVGISTIRVRGLP
ncbi:hypothetical protein OG589_07000 [Sphaerisporangium sp. NBC_01403]|uniref:hypothetical protein n=1 Tax=Sphaerisporangium sp. NBC_01403 TaxID=2903599 RepID=UPI00325564CB